MAALMVAETECMAKRKGEKDTEFVKRLVAAYFNVVGFLGVDAISNTRNAGSENH
jgi:hypothetical protein